MHNLNEVMAVAPSNVVNAATTNEVLSGQIFWGLTTNEWGTQTGSIPTCTLSSNTIVVTAGYYAATTLTNVDADLTSINIRGCFTIFGVTGAVYSPVPKTGQTTSYQTGDDGDLQKGVAWPVPRFADNGDGTVTDNMTELMWTKDANIYGMTNWSAALSNCNECAVDDYTDWRLPNARELFSLMDLGHTSPALPSGHPFTGVQLNFYWTGTSYNATYAWASYVIGGDMGYRWVSKTDVYYVWPVRGP